MNFVILDACRNNPFPASTRATTRGLARMLAPSGSLVAYSTGPGDVAVDGAGDNSPYVLALSQAMRTPGLPAELMFKRVRELVLEATNNEQTPWEESSLKGANFYFSVGVSVTVEAPETLATSDFTAATLQESLFWQSIKDSDNPSDYRAYLQAYPNGVFAMLAETRVEFFETERLATAQDDAAEEAIRSTTTQTEIELAFWNSIKSSSNAADYTAYLDAYPDGSFSALARARLASTEDAGQKAAELELWQSVEASGAAADYQAYIDAYPNGVHAALARARADALQAASEGRTTSIASETELAFWEAIGNEGAAEEYRAYLQQFPDGAFAVLALARMSEAEKTRRQEEELFEADLFPQELEVFAVSFSSLPKVGDALSNRELELAFIRYYKENLTHGWSIDDVTKMVVTRMTEDSIELGMTAQLMRYRHNGSKSGYFIARLEKFGSRYALVNVEW